MDNLKLIEEKIDTDINPNGLPGSVMAENHNAIEKEILKKAGRMTGFPFIAKKTATTLPTGTFSWESNQMNDEEDFIIKCSKLTSDLNDIGIMLFNLQVNDVIHFKDFKGRSAFLRFREYETGNDDQGNEIYIITVWGFSDGLNYAYQDNEIEISMISFHKYLTESNEYTLIFSGNELTLLENGSPKSVVDLSISITDTIVAVETSLAGFVANNEDYTYQQGDVISIVSSPDSILELYMFIGGDKFDESDYIKIDANKIDWVNILNKPTNLTSVSIQDVAGTQQFLMTDHIKFEGVSFDPGNKIVSVDGIIPLSVLLDPVNGNDTTGLVENFAKPFKTIEALWNALPATAGETWTIYLTGGTIPFVRRTTPRNIKWIAYNEATLSFTGVLEADGVTNSNHVFNAGSGTWIFEGRNINISCNYTGWKDFGNGNNGANYGWPITLRGTIKDLRWNSVARFSYIASFPMAIDSDIRFINVYDSSQNNTIFNANGLAYINIETYRPQYGRPLTREPQLGINMTIGRLVQTGATSLTLQLSNDLTSRIPVLKIGSITMTGTLQPNCELFEINGVVASTCNINFEGTRVVTGVLTGTNYHFSTFMSSHVTFRNFTGRLGLLDLFTPLGEVTFQNCNIETNTYLAGRASIHPFADCVNIVGFSTITQADTSQNLFKTSGIGSATIKPIEININGTLNSNVTTYGVNTSYFKNLSTFKEKLNEVVIRNKIDIINKVLSSSTTYIIDGTIILLTGESIEIPAGGLTLAGYGFDVSKIQKNVAGQSIFTSPVGGSGNVVTKDILYNSGAGMVVDIIDSDGSHAIEMNDVNFEGCSSLGTIEGYRQFTGTTIGIYGCSDGFTLDGSWNGFKLTNTNGFNFGSSGTLLKAGATTSFANRMYLELNLSLVTGSAILDFDNTHFASDKLLQVKNCMIIVDGNIDASETPNLFPNISPFDPKSVFNGNVGLTNSKIVESEDIEITDDTKGFIVKDAGDATRRRITVVNGVLTVSAPL